MAMAAATARAIRDIRFFTALLLADRPRNFAAWADSRVCGSRGLPEFLALSEATGSSRYQNLWILMNQRLSRSRMSLSSIALVENLRVEGDRAGKSPASFSPDFQVCLPYRGLFVWHVSQDDVVGDANQVLFVSSGES